MDGIGLYRHFRRALRSFQLYPGGSPVRDESVAALHGALTGENALPDQGLSLAFLEGGAYLDGCFLEAGPEGGKLAREVFELGVREIRYLPGLTVEELSRFFDPLARAMQGQLNPVDEDLSVLLWEADLTHIGYFLYEDQEPEILEAAEGESLAPPVTPDLGEYVDLDLSIGSPGGPEQGLRLNDAERLQILASYRREEREEHPLKYGRILLEILRGEADAADCGRLLECFEEHLDALTSAGRFALLARLRQAVEPDLGASATALSALARAAAWFQSPSLYLRLVRTPPADSTDLRAAQAMLGAASSGILPTLMAAVLDSETPPHPSIRKAVESRLVQDRKGQTLCLQSSATEVRRAALAMIRPGPDDVRVLRPMLRDPDPHIRKGAVLALARAEGPHGLSCLLEALGDLDEVVRTTAAHALGSQGGRRALDPLLRILASKEFDAKGLPEKRALFQAAALASTEEVWPVLARMAEKRRFFPSRRDLERRQASLEALAGLGSKVHEALQHRWSPSRGDLLRQFEVICGQQEKPHRPEEAA